MAATAWVVRGDNHMLLRQAQPTLISEIDVEFGPVELIGRFFLKADAAARERGITLSFGSFDDLVAANRANSASWRRLVTMYDPAFCSLTPDHATCILGRNRAGEVVATQAARVYRLTHTTLHDELESLRAFYDHPERDRNAGEVCTVTAPSARQMVGRVLCGGAAWYRPDYRGRFLSAILPRISRVYAFTRWQTDFTTSLMVEGIVKGGVAERSGYRNIEWAVEIANSPLGNVRCAFVWMTAQRLLEDLEEFLADFDAQIDAPVLQRRA
jgi:hypothetical protein